MHVPVACYFLVGVAGVYRASALHATCIPVAALPSMPAAFMSVHSRLLLYLSAKPYVILLAMALDARA